MDARGSAWKITCSVLVVLAVAVFGAVDLVSAATCSSDAECGDRIACTVDTCDPDKGCLHTPDDSLCDDGVACTIDACDPELETACTHVAEDAQCDDGVECNGAETCCALGCQAGVPTCDDKNACTVDRCDATTGRCSSVANDAVCDDGFDCTVDRCDPAPESGCLHEPRHAVCDDGKDGTFDACLPDKGCDNILIPDDGNACTLDTCDPATGACSHLPITCGDENVCTANACDPATGCVDARPCVDDRLFCNGQEACDGAEGCAHTGSPCLPGWECDEPSRSCRSDLWSYFWDVRAPDETCTMRLLPVDTPDMKEADWDVEARCHDDVVARGHVSDLRVLSVNRFDPPLSDAPRGSMSLTFYWVVAELTNQSRDTRFVRGIVSEYQQEGEAEFLKDLYVLGEASSISIAQEEAIRLGAAVSPEALEAMAAATCSIPSPVPATTADCDATHEGCMRNAYLEATFNAALCMGATRVAATTCIATCPVLGPACLTGPCGLTASLMAICWAGQQYRLERNTSQCNECKDFCYCEYFLDGCEVNGSVGFKVINLCPGEHVTMSGRCWRNNGQRRFEQDITPEDSFYGHPFVGASCPAGTNWEVRSGQVTSTANPEQTPRNCDPQGDTNGTVVANGNHFPTFDCNGRGRPGVECPQQVGYSINVNASTETDVVGGIFLHLAGTNSLNRILSGSPSQIFSFDEVANNTTFSVSVGFNNANENRDKECYFPSNNQNRVDGRIDGADVTYNLKCRAKEGHAVFVSTFNETQSPFYMVDLMFDPDNRPKEYATGLPNEVARFGPVPEGTDYTLSVSGPNYNSNMICLFENGQLAIRGRMEGQDVEHVVRCKCRQIGTITCDPNEDDPHPQTQSDVFNEAWPSCNCGPNGCPSFICGYEGGGCHHDCPPDSGQMNCYPCYCGAACPDPNTEVLCCDRTAPACPIVCEDIVRNWTGPATAVKLVGVAPTTETHPSAPTVDGTLLWNAEAADSDGIGAFFWFIDDVLADHVILNSSATQAASGLRMFDVSHLSEGQHRVTLYAWDNNHDFKAPTVVSMPFIVDHTPSPPPPPPPPGNPCTGDTTDPVVHVTAPAGGSQLDPGNVRIEASATDASGIRRVEFLIDGQTPTQAYDTVAPYSYNWTVTSGSHTLGARAYDNCDRVKLSSTVNVTVPSQTPCANDTQGPSASLTNPHDGDTFGLGAVNMAAIASDPSGIGWVAFFVDGAFSVRDWEAPFAVSQTFTAAGAHRIRARAFDTCGNETWTPEITVNVSNGPACQWDTTAPTVSIVAPANGVTVSRGQVSIALAASDNLGVDTAAFEIDGVVASGAVDQTSPFAHVFTTSSATHTLRAHIVDYCGNDAWSSPVTIQVANRNPTARDDAATVARGGAVTIAVLTNDSDPDGDPIHLAFNAILVPPAHGTAVKNTDGTITYTPSPGFPSVSIAHSDSFRYRIADSYGTVHSAVVTVTVIP